MKILVLGNGAREHALAWKIRNSHACSKVYLHPGNAGTHRAGFESLAVEAHTADSISKCAKERGIELVVIGPETLLAQRFGDILRRDGFLVVGPDQAAARLETSKVFAKEFMVRSGVPTAPFKVAHSYNELQTLLPQTFPTVLKFDGLAAGKGVVIAKNRSEALDFGKRVFDQHEFGADALRILVEDFIPGKEISYIGFCDGAHFIPCESATDYKRVSDSDQGPNTGGMGAVSPSPYFSSQMKEKIDTTVIRPILNGMKKDGMDFKGILYVGLMIADNGEPHVLEFNTRFGDPETQAILLRLESDIVPVLLATAKGTLKNAPATHWSTQASVYLVASAEGYPLKPRLGDVIGGLEDVSKDATLFFSGVSEKEGFLVTSAGRVLGLGTMGKTIEDARNKAYTELKRIHWRGMHFRTDIGLLNGANRNAD